MHAGAPHISEAQAVFLEKFFNFRGTITELAAAMDVPLVDMIDILSAPAVRGRINDAKIITELKRDLIAARAEMAALETLQQITSDRHINPLERRRAATAILRATRPIRARSLLPRACGGGGRFPEAGGGPDSQSRGIGVPPVPSESSPSLIPAVDPAIYIPDESTDFLEETTQSPIEELAQLHEICTQNDATVDPNTEPLSDQAIPTPHPGPSGANEISHGWSADEVETEPVEGKENELAPEGRTKATQTQNGSRPPQKANNNQNSHKPPFPEKDNPWENHPFALAGRRAFGSSTHDPP